MTETDEESETKGVGSDCLWADGREKQITSFLSSLSFSLFTSIQSLYLLCIPEVKQRGYYYSKVCRWGCSVELFRVFRDGQSACQRCVK